MVSVTRENIGSLFPEIEANITKSAFVCTSQYCTERTTVASLGSSISEFRLGIDTEFSGLNLGGPDVRESRFDTASDRYARYRKNITDASLLQLGTHELPLEFYLPQHMPSAEL